MAAGAGGGGVCARRWQAIGSRLILRRGPALAVLEALVAETGAAGVLLVAALRSGGDGARQRR